MRPLTGIVLLTIVSGAAHATPARYPGDDWHLSLDIEHKAGASYLTATLTGSSHGSPYLELRLPDGVRVRGDTHISLTAGLPFHHEWRLLEAPEGFWRLSARVGFSEDREVRSKDLIAYTPRGAVGATDEASRFMWAHPPVFGGVFKETRPEITVDVTIRSSHPWQDGVRLLANFFPVDVLRDHVGAARVVDEPTHALPMTAVWRADPSPRDRSVLVLQGELPVLQGNTTVAVWQDIGEWVVDRHGSTVEIREPRPGDEREAVGLPTTGLDAGLTILLGIGLASRRRPLRETTATGVEPH